MDISMDIARYSMDMATTRAASQAQTAMLRNVMDLQKDSMTQLLASMGLGGALNVQA